MKPQPNLNKNAVKIFHSLVKEIEESGKDVYQVDSYQLSILATNIDILQNNGDKFINEFPNGTTQVNAEFSIKKECEKIIMSIGSKFGLSIKDRKDLGKEAKEVEMPETLDSVFSKAK